MRDGFAVPLPIRTDRLTLRLPTAADEAAITAYRSIPEVCRYLPFEPMDAAEVRRRTREQWQGTRLAQDGDAVTVVLEAAGVPVGDAVLFLVSRMDEGGEIGWVLHPDHRGRGYATEAAGALLAVAFDGLGLHRVVAQMAPENDDSAALATRLGMRREALLRSNARIKGRWEDTLVFALVGDEWREWRDRRD